MDKLCFEVVKLCMSFSCLSISSMIASLMTCELLNVVDDCIRMQYRLFILSKYNKHYRKHYIIIPIWIYSTHWNINICQMCIYALLLRGLETCIHQLSKYEQ